ncbi:MAG: FG-GAP-like repeat-containing protein [Bryobacteraceae bacterium]
MKSPRDSLLSELFSRRSFLVDTALTSMFVTARPRAIAASSTSFASDSCQIKSRSQVSPGLEKFIAKLPPGSDQFVCEKYAAEIEALLRQWSAALRSPGREAAAPQNLIAEDVVFSSFRDFKAVPLRKLGAVGAASIEFSAKELRGREQFLNNWKEYLSGITKIACAEFQVTSLKVRAESPLDVDTVVRYDIVAHSGRDVREERVGDWKLEWQCSSSGEWRIRRWQAVKETRASVAGPAFIEITAECLAGNASYRQQMLRGVDYWRTIYDAAAGVDVYGNNGVAVGDFDGDGFDDFYVCQPSGLPNRLYKNRGDGTFEDVTDATGLGLLDGTASALFADFTNSGMQDLLVVRTSGPLLYLNRGHGKFQLKPDAFQFAKPPAGTFTGVAAADYDRDGFLDIYFCLYAYYQGLSQYTHPKPYYDAQNGPPNFLLRNRGDGTFEDVTERSGMNQNNNRFTFACGWCDYDGNGWPDLYVANDFGRKNFYRNNGDGTFTDIAHEAGVDDFGAGMSVSWFDYDHDGRNDLYVADMWSVAGKRVTEQEYFLSGVDSGIRQAYRKHAAGNSLFQNEGAGQPLSDVTRKAHVAMGRWSWAADVWDFDHDGFADLYVTNGFISGANRQDLSSFFWRQIVSRSLDTGSGSMDYELAWNAINELIRSDHSWNGYERNVFFLNNRDGTFAEISGPLGLDFDDDSRAFALADFDHDGRLEVILKNRNTPQLRILHNELNPIGNSVIFRLRGNKSNRDAIGAVVAVEAETRQVKFLQAGSGFLSQHTKELSFGLGSFSGNVRATVRWPGGGTQSFENVPLNHRVTIEEGSEKFQATPFRLKQPRKKQQRFEWRGEQLPSNFETWLVEPLRAPAFTLPDSNGRTQSLSAFRGRPLVLAMIASDCGRSRDQLAKFQAGWNAFRRESVQIVAINLDGRAANVQFSLLRADEATASIYNILCRYLFDRRRDLEAPVSFLLDEQSAIVKVYQGPVDPEHILKDWKDAPRNQTERLKKALAFNGQYHGGPPRRNYFTYGIAYIQNGFADAAVDSFQAAIAANPNYAPAYYNLGTIYLNKQRLAEAKVNLERAVALDPQDADAWTNLGAVAGQQKDYNAAFPYFQQAVKAKPNHLVALQNLVMLYRWQGRLDQAQKAIENAIAVDPNDPEFHFALGMLLAGQEKFEDARQELERTLQLRANDSIALNNLGVVYLRLGRQDKALECFERCTKMAPDYDRPYMNIALIYRQTGQQQNAKDILKSFLTRHPDNQEVQKAVQESTQ